MTKRSRRVEIGDSARRPTVLGTGLITLDLVLNSASSNIRWAAGGSCGNVLAILAYFGIPTFPIARMNGDTASQFVRKDFLNLGVNLEFSALPPTAETPVITQRIQHRRNGSITHKFGWDCPNCGASLPWYKPVHVSTIKKRIAEFPIPDFFYFDRLSAASIELAEWANACGAWVMFEPSGFGDKNQFDRIMRSVHILKYSNQRFESPVNAIEESPSILLEVQTKGEDGLQFRSQRNGRATVWHHLRSKPITQFKDAAGAGDWTSAGIIAELLLGRVQPDSGLSIKYSRVILENASSLGGWACQFEGARGAIYDAASTDDEPSEVRRYRERFETDQIELESHFMAASSAICPSCVN